MTTTAYLATVEETTLWDTLDDTLVLFLMGGTIPPSCLTDPEVVGLAPASGNWCLTLWDEAAQRAFYSRSTADSSVMCEADAARYLEDGYPF
jgi:hypothetical protein